jgi:hypothetical protein
MKDTYTEIQNKVVILNSKIDELAKAGEIKSRAEANYRVALASFLAKEIAEGKKVTVLGDLARGQKDIALLRKNRDKYNILYDTTLESIFAIKTQIRINETMLKLEWGNCKNE